MNIGDRNIGTPPAVQPNMSTPKVVTAHRIRIPRTHWWKDLNTEVEETIYRTEYAGKSRPSTVDEIEAYLEAQNAAPPAAMAS